MPSTSRLSLSAFACALLVAATAFAQSRTFAVTAGGGSRISFTSDAPLETMRGTSQQVSGEFTVDPAALAGARGTISVPIASLRTGIDLRDSHLRSDTWLDAARYPNATFELTGVSGATALVEGQETRVTLRGRFSLHGRTRNVSARARVTWQGSALNVRAHFGIRLSDYGVSIPEVVQLKVSNDIGIDVSLRGVQR